MAADFHGDLLNRELRWRGQGVMCSGKAEYAMVAGMLSGLIGGREWAIVAAVEAELESRQAGIGRSVRRDWNANGGQEDALNDESINRHRADKLSPAAPRSQASPSWFHAHKPGAYG
jgi:hypothetical protein